MRPLLDALNAWSGRGSGSVEACHLTGTGVRASPDDVLRCAATIL